MLSCIPILLLGGLAVAQELCVKTTTPVTACSDADLTTENWNKFNIDGFLAQMIGSFGTSDNYPRFFVQQFTPPSDPINNFDCSNLQNTANCAIPGHINPDAATNCVFEGLQGTFCAGFTSPEAGFVVKNYINLFQGLFNHAAAVRQAANAIISANFINTMVQALAPKKQPIAPAVFSLIADLVTDILPIGGEIKAATTFMKKIRLIIKETKSDLKDDSKDILSIVEANADIDKEVSATEDQLNQQLNNIVTGTQARIQKIVDQIFGKNQDPQSVDIDGISSSFAFQNAQHGMFLDDVPEINDLAGQMQKQLQNWIVSNVLQSMGYDVTIDTTELEDPPGAPGTVCHAENGFTAGGGCALFRIGAIGSGGNVIDGAQQGNNIFALQTTAGIDIGAMIGNAQACNNGGGGGATDFASFLEMENGDSLPPCMFNFKVVTTKL